MAANTHRLTILTLQEIDDLYALPRFTEEDRHTYFALDEAEQQLVDCRSTAVAAHLILQLGYFKAKSQFFDYEPDDAHVDDLNYILARHFPGRKPVAISVPSAPTQRGLQDVILELCNFRLCDTGLKAELEYRAQRLAMLSTQPVYILRETLQHLKQHRIVLPTYTFLQDMVGRVVSAERRRVSDLLSKALTTKISAQIDAMLSADESMYQVNILKREPKDFSYKELRAESDRRKFFAPLHEFGRKFLEKAGISNDSVRYYASLVKFYTVYKLQRMPSGIRRLFLLCFAYHQFRQNNDNLIDAFIHLVGQYEKAARLAANDAAQNAMAEASTDLKAAGQVLHLFVDDTIPRNASFASVRQKAFSLLPLERFEKVSNYMSNVAFDKTGFEWEHYVALSRTIKRNIRHIFVGLDVAGRVADAPLMKAVAFLQGMFRSGKSPQQYKSTKFPTAIIPKGLQAYLYPTESDKKKQLDVNRYEFLVYRQLQNALEAGDVFSNNSNEFRRFEDDLISDERWKNKDAILRDIDSPVLLAPIEKTEAALHDDIDAQLKIVNESLKRRDNPYLKVRQQKGKRRWGLVYPDPEETVNHAFYSQLAGINVARLLWFVAERTGFLNAFTHVLNRYAKRGADHREILACVVAMGTNIGLRKMAEVSGLSYASLVNTARNFLRPETMHIANDAHLTERSARAADLTTSLCAVLLAEACNTGPEPFVRQDIPALRRDRLLWVDHNYVRDDTFIAANAVLVAMQNRIGLARTWGGGDVASADGMRFVVPVRTIRAAPNPKYFNRGRGVTWYNLISDQRTGLNAITVPGTLRDSLVLLTYMNDVKLRQAVQKALNRGEAYHRLRRAISFVNGGKLRVHTEAEQQLWNDCSRLIANAIIHYNTALLSRVYEQKRAAGDQSAMDLIAGMSPVAWQHVNLFGAFDFGQTGAVDMDTLAAYYEDPAYWARIQQAPHQATNPDPPGASARPIS